MGSTYGERVCLQAHIRDVISAHGGTREAARATRIDPAYLHRLATGEKDNPTDATLRKLGLHRKVIYVRG
jgi:hypothetical protein